MNRSALQSLILLLTVSLIYGSSFMLLKRGVESLSPLQVAATRLAAAGLIFLPFSLRSLREIPRNLRLPIMAVALIGAGVPSCLLALAQSQVSSSMVGALNSMPPLWVLVIGVVAYKQNIGVGACGGILLGLSGVLVLMFFSADDLLTGNNSYGAFVLLAGLGYGLSMLIIQTKLSRVKARLIPAATYVLLLPVTLGLVLTTAVPSAIFASAAAWHSFNHVILLSLFANVFGFSLFVTLIQRENAAYASIVHYLVPPIATLWGFLDGEILSWNHFVGMALIGAGVYVTTRPVNRGKLN